MTPTAVLAEIRRRGAVAYRVGDMIRLRPASVLPAELVDAVRQHKAALMPLVPGYSRDCDPAFADVDAYLIKSRLLGETLWMAPDDATAVRLEGELAAEGDHRLVFTVAEVVAVAGMLDADRRTVLAAVVRIKRAMPGAVLDCVTPPDEAKQ
jgi:hypothetical protein